MMRPRGNALAAQRDVEAQRPRRDALDFALMVLAQAHDRALGHVFLDLPSTFFSSRSRSFGSSAMGFPRLARVG